MGRGSGLGFRVGVRVRVLASHSLSPRAHAPTQRRRCRSAPGRGTYLSSSMSRNLRSAFLRFLTCVYFKAVGNAQLFAPPFALGRLHVFRVGAKWSITALPASIPVRTRSASLAGTTKTATARLTVPHRSASCNCYPAAMPAARDGPGRTFSTLERGLVRLPKSHTAGAVQPQ